MRPGWVQVPMSRWGWGHPPMWGMTGMGFSPNRAAQTAACAESPMPQTAHITRRQEIKDNQLSNSYLNAGTKPREPSV